MAAGKVTGWTGKRAMAGEYAAELGDARLTERVKRVGVAMAQTQPWAWKLVLDLVRSEGRDAFVASADRLARHGLIPDDELQVRLRTPLRHDESELVWRGAGSAPVTERSGPRPRRSATARVW